MIAGLCGVAIFAAVVSLPPIQEQHRIVAKINRLMSLCNALDEKIDAAGNQQAALLNALMGQM